MSKKIINDAPDDITRKMLEEIKSKKSLYSRKNNSEQRNRYMAGKIEQVKNYEKETREIAKNLKETEDIRTKTLFNYFRDEDSGDEYVQRISSKPEYMYKCVVDAYNKFRSEYPKDTNNIVYIRFMRPDEQYSPMQNYRVIIEYVHRINPDDEKGTHEYFYKSYNKEPKLAEKKELEEKDIISKETVTEQEAAQKINSEKIDLDKTSQHVQELISKQTPESRLLAKIYEWFTEKFKNYIIADMKFENSYAMKNNANKPFNSSDNKLKFNCDISFVNTNGDPSEIKHMKVNESIFEDVEEQSQEEKNSLSQSQIDEINYHIQQLISGNDDASKIYKSMYDLFIEDAKENNKNYLLTDMKLTKDNDGEYTITYSYIDLDDDISKIIKRRRSSIT